jgi:Tfp pilus assembly protein PilF
MSTSNIEDTSPTNIQQTPEPKEERPISKIKRRYVVLGGILLVVLLGALGSFIGYQLALQDRIQREEGQLTMTTTTQFQLALSDLENGRYEVARDRLEYIISLDPSFPGATEKLTEAMMAMAMVSTPTEALPTMTASPEITATIDTRTADQLYEQALQYMRAQDWANALVTLDSLRSESLEYRTLDVDGMYYIAYRFRGVEKIINQGNLAGGMYDLALSERFAPIDGDANGYRQWARQYLTGASFWGVDWGKVVEYFSQIFPSLPNLRDGSSFTAAERYRIALKEYAAQILNDTGDACAARDYYQQSLQIGPDGAAEATATMVQMTCEPATSTPGAITETPTGPVGTTEVPTVDPGAATATPTPTATLTETLAVGEETPVGTTPDP